MEPCRARVIGFAASDHPGGMNHKGSALDLERQDAQGCTLMHYICSLRNGPALQLLLRANVDPAIADTQARQHGQSGRLGGATAGHHGLLGLRLKA